MYKTNNNKLPSVLITGCSSGLGHALALRFIKSGYPTYASARRLESIGDLADAGCVTLQLDVTDIDSIQKAVKTVEDIHGHVGILINNAAIGIMTPMETIPLEQVRRQYETNVFGLLAITQTVIPAMRNAGQGRIVNCGSSGGEFTTPGGGVYQATKYALDSMNDAMRMELKSFGIDVVLIEPGAISSNFGKNGAVLGKDEGAYIQLMRGIDVISSKALQADAIGTWSPDEVAQVVHKAATIKKPNARYRPGIVAKLLIYMKILLPISIWDSMYISSLNKAGQEQ